METDQEFLIWLHERLEHVHNENDLMGYMHHLRAIILNTPKNQISESAGCNDLKSLKEKLNLS